MSRIRNTGKNIPNSDPTFFSLKKQVRFWPQKQFYSNLVYDFWKYDSTAVIKPQVFYEGDFKNSLVHHSSTEDRSSTVTNAE